MISPDVDAEELGDVMALSALPSCPTCGTIAPESDIGGEAIECRGCDRILDIWRWFR